MVPPPLLTVTVEPSGSAVVVLGVAGVSEVVSVPSELVTVVVTLPSPFTTVVVDVPSELATVVVVPLVVTVSPLLFVVVTLGGST